MGALSIWHIIIVAVVVVLLFGTKKLPELGDGLGKAIANFRSAYREGMALDVTPKKEEEKKTDGAGPEKPHA